MGSPNNIAYCVDEKLYVICFHKSNNSRVVLIIIQPKFEDRGIGSNCPSSAHVRKIFVTRKACGRKLQIPRYLTP